jgi:hypothetical protein
LGADCETPERINTMRVLYPFEGCPGLVRNKALMRARFVFVFISLGSRDVIAVLDVHPVPPSLGGRGLGDNQHDVQGWISSTRSGSQQ